MYTWHQSNQVQKSNNYSSCTFLQYFIKFRVIQFKEFFDKLCFLSRIFKNFSLENFLYWGERTLLICQFKWKQLYWAVYWLPVKIRMKMIYYEKSFFAKKILNCHKELFFRCTSPVSSSLIPSLVLVTCENYKDFVTCKLQKTDSVHFT